MEILIIIIVLLSLLNIYTLNFLVKETSKANKNAQKEEQRDDCIGQAQDVNYVEQNLKRQKQERFKKKKDELIRKIQELKDKQVQEVKERGIIISKISEEIKTLQEEIKQLDHKLVNDIETPQEKKRHEKKNEKLLMELPDSLGLEQEEDLDQALNDLFRAEQSQEEFLNEIVTLEQIDKINKIYHGQELSNTELEEAEQTLERLEGTLFLEELAKFSQAQQECLNMRISQKLTELTCKVNDLEEAQIKAPSINETRSLKALLDE